MAKTCEITLRVRYRAGVLFLMRRAGVAGLFLALCLVKLLPFWILARAEVVDV